MTYLFQNTLANNREDQRQHLQEMTDYAFGGTGRPKTAPSQGETKVNTNTLCFIG